MNERKPTFEMALCDSTVTEGYLGGVSLKFKDGQDQEVACYHCGGIVVRAFIKHKGTSIWFETGE